MKHLLAFMLVLVILLSLAACGKDAPSPTDSGTSAPSTSPDLSEPAATPDTSAPSTDPTGTTQPQKDNDDTTDPDKDTGESNELYRIASYTASDADVIAARDTVVATLGDAKLTNGMLQIYYWLDVYDFLSNYGYYAALYGLDYTKPLDQQNYFDSEGTWQHYFLQNALEQWHYYQALALIAEETQTPLEPSMQKALDNLYDDLKKSAQDGKFDSVDAMIQADAGPGCTAEDYYRYSELYYNGYSYFGKMVNAIEITDKMIEDYFAAHQDELKEQGITKDSGNVYSVRHILISVADTKTDADWAACLSSAEDLLNKWLTGEATEDTFAALAKEHSTDGGSSSNGGLYQGLDKDTNFVQEFKDWYLDESRKPGDYGLVKTTYGYHLMYLSDSEAQWISQCRQDVNDELSNQIIEDALNHYTLTIEYDKIALGQVDLE